MVLTKSLEADTISFSYVSNQLQESLLAVYRDYNLEIKPRQIRGVIFLSWYVKCFTRLEEVVSGKVVEETVIIGSLPVLKAFELDLSGLLLFSVIDAFTRISDIVRVDVVKDVEL